MKRIGLISDTHGYLDEAVFDHFKACDEIWHAGDIGTGEIITKLEAFKPLRAVSGNIDGQSIRAMVPENQHFEVEGVHIWITHIGGYPPRYNPQVRPALRAQTPDIFVCGHSHILRVMRDPALSNMLYLNPGAAGKEGFHKMRTLLRFSIESGKVKDMEVVELGLRGAIKD
ncbi:metallophosphoesterase family protein [Persicitalea jodogahamensis]|uniref:Phosphoesterase n=1 Tax=Persicitalea jodogahamensis TaxID=402147 RepID=A0A8J3DCF4_9BACT|nr:metallophosphoesterase family protein [Persicitalea jodogahamensis]GHB82462.1 phosphoesterase [Persicitalea jodogahamensis]